MGVVLVIGLVLVILDSNEVAVCTLWLLQTGQRMYAIYSQLGRRTSDKLTRALIVAVFGMM